MLAIIIIIALFCSLVLLHEWGHFIVAKRGGIEAEEFGIGFPPRLWGKKYHGTLYSINLFPLGGFVRMKGEDSSDKSPGSFGAAKFSLKAKVLLAGVGMNLLTALVIFYGLALTGLPPIGAPFEPSFLKSTYAEPKELILAQVEKGSPAEGIGLKRGDYVISANGTRMETDDQLYNFTKANAGKTVVLDVRSHGDEKYMNVKLRSDSKEGFLGVVTQQVYKLRYDPLRALVASAYIVGMLFFATIWGVIMLLFHLPTLIFGLFQSAVPAAAQSAAGPLGIVFILKTLSALGLPYIMLFMGNISVALAAFNVLPLPALDGGRLAVLTMHRFTRRRMSAETEARYHMVGFIALICLMLLISVYDLRKYF